MMRIFAAAALLGMWVVPCEVSGQIWDRITNSRSKFEVVHPPRVPLAGVTKISVLEFTGDWECGPELTERLIQRLSEIGGFEIIDRRSLGAVLNEQDFQASGAVSAEAQVRLGELLGPAALVVGRITTCKTDQPDLVYQDFKTRNGSYREYYARSAAILTASVALIDLTTGRRHSLGVITRADTVTNTARNARPEYPSIDAPRLNVFNALIREAVQALYPTSEQVEVVLYDDDNCDLKRAANLIKVSDFQGAASELQRSISNQCDRPDDTNLLAKAYYNLGVALTYSNSYNEALVALRRSGGLRETGITREAMEVVNRMLSAESERKRAEEAAIELGAPEQANAPEPLTNGSIIEMAKAKLSDDIILAQIAGSPCRFDTTPTGLIALKQAGVSDPIMLAMQEAAASRCRR